ncbi:MAG: hypothetical protein JJE39_02015, partial [Vicinamibacteria bacterium]|nr:hypothetical protein [Vicinamibacteria bacterium]
MQAKSPSLLLSLLFARSVLAGTTGAPVSVDDLMRLRSIHDVQISPDGRFVAYVVSQPNLERNEHETALFLVSSTGGVPRRLTYGARIANRPRPNPRLRWSPDGSWLS